MYRERLERILLGKIRLASSILLSEEVLKSASVSVDHVMDMVSQDLVVKLETSILGLPGEKIDVYYEWPSDWWEAFKERWFPHWLLKRFPAEYRTAAVCRQTYRAACPHLPGEDREVHLRWLIEEASETKEVSIAWNA